MVSSEGGCFCGKVRYSVSGEPALTALCHCMDCRKISGSTYSTNMIIKEDSFRLLSGTPKIITKTADGGNPINSYFCGDCGSTTMRDGDSFPGMKIIKVGTLDRVDAFDVAKPVAELFTPTRVNWVHEIPGADQKKAMS